MTDGKKPADWGEYEERGVPVLDFLLACFDGEIPSDPVYVELKVEWLAELWLKHHPERESTQGFDYSSYTGTAKPGFSPAVMLTEDRPGGSREGGTSHLVPACGHVSDPDVSGKRHTCFLPQSHEGAGIAHEDETSKWYRAQPKPFKKVAT